jgi:hypothetical protein
VLTDPATDGATSAAGAAVLARGPRPTDLLIESTKVMVEFYSSGVR